MTPANDNRLLWDGSTVYRGGTAIYQILEGERVAPIGFDKLIIAHPDRRPKLISALDGQFLGEIRA